MIQGVDLYQGNSFSPATGAGFVFLKASEGRTLRDTQFAARWAQLGAMGTVRGAYHFPNFGNAPATDFAFFASIVGPVLRPGDLLALDFEGDNDTHTWAERTSWKNSFLALAKQRFPDHRVGVYCNLSWWHGTDNNYGDFLWIADYTTAGAPRVQAPWTFHQYSTSGGVDHDVANFPSLQALRAWAGGTAPAPIPQPVPTPEDTMPTFSTGQLLPGFACDANGTVVDATKATMVVTPPANGGALPWGDMWLSLGCDFNPAKVRVAIHDGNTWAISTVTVNPPDGRLVVAKLPANVGKISLCRVPLSPQDTNDDTPVAWLVEAGAR